MDYIKSIKTKVDKFNAKLVEFSKETGEQPCRLYEDINTSYEQEPLEIVEAWEDDDIYFKFKDDILASTYDEVLQWLRQLNADLKRAKRYFEMSAEEIDRITEEGEQEDENN